MARLAQEIQFLDKSFRHPRSDIVSTITLNMSHYFFVSSEDSKDIHPMNSLSDFIVELPRMYDLEGQWEIALLDVEVSKSSVSMPDLYLFCDLCENSYSLDSELPVLRRFTFKTETFPTPYYIRLSCRIFNRFRIYIRNKASQSIPVDAGSLYCTLHIRKSS